MTAKEIAGMVLTFALTAAGVGAMWWVIFAGVPA